MSKLELLLIVFGFLILLHLLNQNNENFTYVDDFKMRPDDFMIESNYGLPATGDRFANEDYDLAKIMDNIIEKEDENQDQGLADFQKDNLESVNIPNYYLTEREIPYDVKRHEYKLEKNPRDVINKMQENNEPVELRKVYNETVKDYKRDNLNKVDDYSLKESANTLISVDQAPFSYLDETKVPDSSDIQALDPIQSSFSKY
jgi:hypothetical protein